MEIAVQYPLRVLLGKPLVQPLVMSGCQWVWVQQKSLDWNAVWSSHYSQEVVALKLKSSSSFLGGVRIQRRARKPSLPPPSVIDIQDLAALNLRPAARWPLLEKLIVHISIFQGHIPWSPLSLHFQFCKMLTIVPSLKEVLEEWKSLVIATHSVRSSMKWTGSSHFYCLCFMV